jgi:hypothetical protein
VSDPEPLIRSACRPLPQPHRLAGRHPRNDAGPIGIGTIARAANQLDLALAMGEVYRSDPSFAAPREVWDRLQAACPDLLA